MGEGDGRDYSMLWFQRETATVDIPREDGDSVRVWVRATDVTTLYCVSERDSDCGHPERGR